jgi:hypothetical protein
MNNHIIRNNHAKYHAECSKWVVRLFKEEYLINPKECHGEVNKIVTNCRWETEKS